MPKIRIKIGKASHLFLIDTGSFYSSINKSDIPRELMRNIQKFEKPLKCYNNNPLKIMGQIEVPIKLEDGKKHLINAVVVTHGINIIGLKYIKELDLITFNKIENKKNLFSLKLKEGATSKKIPPRTVPFHFKKAFAAEIKILLDEGIIEKSKYSEWAAPIVIKKRKKQER